MAYDIGPRIGIQGEKEFNNQIKNINNSLKEYGSEMNALTGKFSENEKGQQALIEKTKVLEKQYDAQKQKSSILQAQYDKEVKKLRELKGACEKAAEVNGKSSAEAAKAETAFNKQAEMVSKLKVAMNETEGYANKLENSIKANKNALSEMDAGTRDAITGLSDLKNAADDAGDELEDIGKKLDVGILIDAADTFSNLSDKMMDAAEGSKEFMSIMGQLEVSSQNLGYTSEQTGETLKQLYGVLGDDQTAATATANLQALGLSQSELTSMTEGVIGAWAQYGDSIPIDSLAEAVNETAKVGNVTGTFADVLNWAGTNEDEFNEKLQACSSESDRAKLILQELADQGLMKSADAFRENNKALIENNESGLSYQQTMAEMGEKILPILTIINEVLAKVMGAFNSLPGPVQNALLAFLGVVGVIGKIAPIIASLKAIGIAGSLARIGTLITGTIVPAIGGALAAAAPVIAVIAGIALAITGVILVIKNWDKIVEWFKERIGTAIETIKGIFGSFGEKITEVKDKFVGKITEMKEGAVEKFQELKDSASEKFETIRNTISEKTEAIRSATAEKLGNVKKAYEDAGGGIKGIAAGFMQAVSDTFGSRMDFINTLTGGKLAEINEKFKDKLQSVKDIVKSGIDAVKGIFDKLKLKLPEIKIPKIKLPHFSIKGGFSLNPPKIPSFSVDWYKEGAILSGAQIFGSLGNKLLGGGEAGKEAVLPLSSFYSELGNILSNSIREIMADYSNSLQVVFSPVTNVYVGNKEFESYIVETSIRGNGRSIQNLNAGRGRR